MFRDRKDAGRRLAKALSHYQGTEPLILAIPRGGVEVAVYVAAGLEAEWAILVVRKLPLPDNPEAGFGAIAEDGSTFMFEHIVATLPLGVVEKTVEQQKREIRRRIAVLRHDIPLPPLAGRSVILVDDGIAMGSTVRAAVTMCRKHKVGKIVVAAPVASPRTAEELTALTDDIVILEKPASSRAVAQAYQTWYDVPDEEVLHILAQFGQFHTA
jgi:putative phosphoribosyl transferase